MLIDFSKVDSFYTDFQIDELKKYLETLETLLKKELDDFKKRVDAAAKKITDPQERNEYYEFYSDDYWRLDETFVRMVRNSFFVMAFSFMEDRLGDICDNLQKEHKMQFSWRDLRHDVLERANLYIKSLMGEAPNTISVWKNIKNYQKLRNCIVHNNGEPQDKGLISYAHKEGILPAGEERLFLTDSFCKQCLDDFHTFFKELYDSFYKRKQPVK